MNSLQQVGNCESVHASYSDDSDIFTSQPEPQFHLPRFHGASAPPVTVRDCVRRCVVARRVLRRLLEALTAKLSRLRRSGALVCCGPGQMETKSPEIPSLGGALAFLVVSHTFLTYGWPLPRVGRRRPAYLCVYL